ncbi:protease inhibitor I42 family protein [Bacillus sp. FSL K6-0268]|uniref:protease inhibitor I42 family protein n=1 Tax=Bacillus sp. FSL K6-0268 TaxID=2921449 RepID=UPI0030F4C482
MNVCKTIKDFLFVSGVVVSSLTIIPLNLSAESVLTTETMNYLDKAPYSAIFTEASHNKTFSIKKGETFAIRLQENPTAGYVWMLDPMKQNISLITNYIENIDPLSEENGPIGVGRGGLHTFVFKGDSLGMNKIQLKYARPWETEPIHEYTLKINVIN